MRKSSRTRPARAASTAWSAAISTPPRCAISAASNIIMTAIGSKAAPRWSSISTAGWRCSTGPTRSPPRGATSRAAAIELPAGGLSGRCASRSSPMPGRRRSTAWSARCRRCAAELERQGHERAGHLARPVSLRCRARPIPKSAWRWPRARRGRRDARPISRPTRSISRPKGRCASPRGAGA